MRLSSLTILLSCSLAGSPAFAEVRRVNAGGDLQAALNAARAGDEIQLEAAATFTGNFVLPVFEGDAPITLRTARASGAPEDANQRITPAAAARLAKIASPGSEAALRTAPGARHWRLMLLELPANKGGYGDIVQ